MIWRMTDPRYGINKRANIVIVCTSLPQFASVASVETKNGWNILSLDRRFDKLDCDKNWGPGWAWTFLPRESEKTHDDLTEVQSCTQCPFFHEQTCLRTKSRLENDTTATVGEKCPLHDSAITVKLEDQNKLISWVHNV